MEVCYLDQLELDGLVFELPKEIVLIAYCSDLVLALFLLQHEGDLHLLSYGNPAQF